MTDPSQLSDEERHLATMKETPTLKPCLCGKVPTYELFDGDGFRLPRVKWEQIKCKCGISTEPEQPGCRTPDLVTRWNTRAESEILLAANEIEEALKPVEDVTEADENGHQVELFLLGKEIRAIHAALARFRALKPKGGER